MPTTSHSDSAITARGVTKRYGAVQALAGVDVSVPRGVAFGLIGPNGAGKTTFIKVLLGIARPDSGEVRLLGGRPDDVAVRRRIGYLPENLQLPGAWSALAFLRSVARLKGLRGADVATHIAATLRRVGLEESAWAARTGGYSKGMRQRTGLAAALLGEPDLLVLDEPTDGIDPLGRAAIRGVIQEETARGATVFLNSHLLAETERLCAEVAIMGRGRVMRSGRVDLLRKHQGYTLRVVGDAQAAAYFADQGWATSDQPVWEVSLEIDDAVALSVTLRGALAAGLTVVEARRDSHGLEDVLADVVAVQGALDPAGGQP